MIMFMRGYSQFLDLVVELKSGQGNRVKQFVYVLQIAPDLGLHAGLPGQTSTVGNTH